MTDDETQCGAETCDEHPLDNCAYCWDHATDEMRREFAKNVGELR